MHDWNHHIPHTCHPNTTALWHVGRDVALTTTGLEACYRALRLPVDIRILGSPHHVYKDCVLPLKKTALTGSFSVSLTHFVSHCRLVCLHCLVHCPHLCLFSSVLCIVWCPIGMPSPSSFLKRSKDLTLNLDFKELIHSISSHHTGDTPYHIM